MDYCFRMIGPAMPSRELLEAAAELTEAAGLLRYLLFTHNTLVLVSNLSGTNNTNQVMVDNRQKCNVILLVHNLIGL